MHVIRLKKITNVAESITQFPGQKMTSSAALLSTPQRVRLISVNSSELLMKSSAVVPQTDYGNRVLTHAPLTASYVRCYEGIIVRLGRLSRIHVSCM